jgi:hypothetical protein
LRLTARIRSEGRSREARRRSASKQWGGRSRTAAAHARRQPRERPARAAAGRAASAWSTEPSTPAAPRPSSPRAGGSSGVSQPSKPRPPIAHKARAARTAATPRAWRGQRRGPERNECGRPWGEETTAGLAGSRSESSNDVSPPSRQTLRWASWARRASLSRGTRAGATPPTQSGPVLTMARGPNASSASCWLCRRQRSEMFAAVAGPSSAYGWMWCSSRNARSAQRRPPTETNAHWPPSLNQTLRLIALGMCREGLSAPGRIRFS